MNAPLAACSLERNGDDAVLTLRGEWRLQRLSELRSELRGLALDALAAGAARIDGRSLAAIDTAAALLLWHAVQAAGAEPARIALDGFDPATGASWSWCASACRGPACARLPVRTGMLAQLGMQAVSFGALVAGPVAVLGLTLAEIARVVARPSLLRKRELMAQFGQVCVLAIPVILLVTFLIGTIVAYLLGLQAEQYGANIFVVDGVALGMVREFSPIIVATIVAGRSGRRSRRSSAPCG